MNSAVATRLLIHGRVQGVGYRAWLAGEARRRGLSGWVRNRRAGSVEALLFAEEAALAELLVACRMGPPTASVTRIEILEIEPGEADGPFTGFDVRPTI
ncbi:acylphosphatase [Ancylobacter sp. VNQ12]|uniref:acylphosphatase n=1 Tax=Ancylobacter sp. VNQ12 TaxID=3400920 RepID=UPI003C09DCFC